MQQQPQQHGDDGSSSTDAQSWYARLVQLPPQQQQQQPGDDHHQQHQQQQHAAAPPTSKRGAVPPPSQPPATARATGFVPVKFAAHTHWLDPNTGVVTLAPKAGGGSSSSSAPQQQQQSSATTRQQQQQQQAAPHHPEAAAHIASTKRPIDRGNLGFQLLAKAGWQPGQGLGAAAKGITAPLAVTRHAGNTGLGFAPSQQQQVQQAVVQQQQQQPAGASASTSGDAAPAAAAGPVLGAKRVASLVAAELAAEGLDAKVRRHRQVRAAEAKDARDKAIQTALLRSFNEVEGPDANPVLAKSHRLTATNPLLD